MGANIEQVVIGKIRVKKGDKVNKGDILFEIVTDKATFEVEADATGTILDLRCKEGDNLNVLEVVGYIGEKHESIPQAKKSVKEVSEEQVKVTPKARKLAKDNNINIDTAFAGSKKIIREEDILAMIVPKKGEINIELVSLTARKKAEIAALSYSKNYLFSSVTIQVSTTPIKDKVKKLADKHEIRLPFGQYLYHCVALAIPDFPLIKSYYSDEAIRQYKDINLGIAINPDEGLVVPIIKKANELNIVAFTDKFNELVLKAFKNELATDDLQDGTFTITDLSSYKAFDFTPIINKNQSAILGLGAEYDSCKQEKGSLIYDPKINITLAFDHRVIDGKYAAQFLQKVITVATAMSSA